MKITSYVTPSILRNYEDYKALSSFEFCGTKVIKLLAMSNDAIFI